MNPKISIDLGNVQKTLLLPLWGRAVETKKKKPLLVDNLAVEIIDKIDYDFSTITRNIRDITQLAWIARSLLIDETISKFLRDYPKSTIVNVGCGLDTTFDRIDNGVLRWYDLDLPDVIDLRKNFILENKRRQFIAASLIDHCWFKELEIEGPVLFIAAGVLYYFEEDQVKNFLTGLADNFPGSEIIFDACSPKGVEMANKLVIKNAGMDENSFLKWGILNAAEMNSWDKRIKVLGEYLYFRRLEKDVKLKNRLLGFISDHMKIQYLIHAAFLTP